MVATARDQVDDLTYNHKGSMQHDDAADNDSGDIESAHPVGARGADNQPTNRDFSQEDQETEKSEHTGKIPRSEVNDLLDSATKDERGASGRTRGVKNDAFKQEREMDQALADTGITDAQQSIEIERATGPTS